MKVTSNSFVIKVLYALLILIDLLVILVVWFLLSITISIPQPQHTDVLKLNRLEKDKNFYTIGRNWLKKSETGLWEMYVEGDGFERGVIEGKLTKELAEQQEVAFVNQIRKMIPSEKLLHYLKFFISFFNRKLDEHIVQEYKDEIYGESLYASDKFDFIAPKYYRMLNYHAAHDIGHALQDKYMLVGCSSFGVWANRSADSTLVIGRNFDFYVGDAFAENKLINFIKPEKGYRLMMISWAGMIGTVSGMNEKGLTVTINASKSEVPASAATPISLVAREILQYASTIDEAYVIAKKRKTFVSESILIGSKNDNRVAIIEKTPSRTVSYNSSEKDFILCTNHYQSDAFKNNPVNIENKSQSSSLYRMNHLNTLVKEAAAMDVKKVAAILRNQKGANGKDIGMGNEKAINQLIAHHSVIFKPQQLQVWVSTQPFQLGAYICYDLKKVFDNAPVMAGKKEIYEKQFTIAADTFLYSKKYQRFIAYKQTKEAFRFVQQHRLHPEISEHIINGFINCNPEYFETYVILGTYFKDEQQYTKALSYYNMALTKELTTEQDRIAIQKAIQYINLIVTTK